MLVEFMVIEKMGLLIYKSSKILDGFGVCMVVSK